MPYIPDDTRRPIVDPTHMTTPLGWALGAKGVKDVPLAL